VATRATPSRRKKTTVEPTMTARRREVLDTASRLFHERGYQGTSMDEIADAVGLTKGSLYHYFSSKTQILAAIYEEAADLVVEHTTRVDASAPVEDAIRSLVHSILELIAEHRHHVTVYYQEMRWMREWLPAKDARRIQKKVQSYIDYVDSIVARGIKEGVLKPVDSHLAALALVGMASWAYQWYSPDGRLGPDAVADLFTDIYLRGMES
jgi:AcrR family transcriptional regulator